MTAVPVSTEVFTELARTRPLPAATTALRAALHTRRLLLLKSLLVRVERRRTALQSVVRRRFEADWTLLERAEHTDAAVVRDVVDYPMTGAWLAEALAAPDGPLFEEHLARLGGVAVAAAVRAGCRFDITSTLPSDTLSLPGLGLLRCPARRIRLSGDTRAVRITDDAGGSVALARAMPEGADPRNRPHGSLSWTGLRALSGGGAVLDDLDPHRVPPGGIGPAALPAAERTHSGHPAWAARWRTAQALLAVADPGRAAETTALVRAVVPLASPVHIGVPTSATLRTAPGAVLAQLPADPRDLAELLVHETQHTKLAAFDEMAPLCRPGGGTLHPVAWRRDPRPVPGVLQGAYAHLALLDLWRRARVAPASSPAWRRRAEERFEAHWEGVGEALSILRESDELTSAGREFVHNMATYHRSLGGAACQVG
ncbi:aKG-HExxH-type peptide beta-hydroxylase [Streptomyces sp. TRM68367]|uniref:aKG-HExxH-type peptide beta-hydroxylase n=1 Tax=Streptomyces sp. TRM68367 TaxID=2758415 RepID=UPI00293499DA|nr:HEXXH motif-containing putative peptide modification protein [Streptomyces sp. TRM68367]